MKKLIQTLRENKFRIILCFLGGIPIAFLIPFFLSIQKVANILLIELFSILSLIAILVIFFLLTYRPASNIWRRYKNNHKLKNPPFTYADNIAVLLFSCVLFSLIFRERLWSDILLPSTCLHILRISGVFGIVWVVCIYNGLFVPEEKEDEKGKLKTEESTLIFPDEAITHEKEDKLERKSFVNDLYRQIVNLPFSDSFVIGLYGKWGEGKTSVLNLLRNKLLKNEGVILVEFDPWYFRNQEALIKNFYRRIENAINKVYFFPDFNKALRKYQSILTFGLKRFGLDLHGFMDDEELEGIKKRIDSYIQRIERKLIIFIDDIDRLPHGEVLSVFKLVRLSAKFKNTIFVLSFDPLVIRQNCKDSLAGDPSFLEKVVQQPIELPSADQFDIDKFLFYSYPEEDKSVIDRLFEKLNIDKEKTQQFNKDFPTIYNSGIRKLCRTLRNAKRYINGLCSTLPSVKNEINLYDFFILEAIRVFCPAVYNDIWVYPWYYIPAWTNEAFSLSPFYSVANDDEKYKQIKEHIEKLIANEPNKDVILELLKAIFPVEVENAFKQVCQGIDSMAKTYRKEGRITHPDCFKKYFMLKVPSRELSDEEIESTIKSWNALDEQKLPEMLKNTYSRFQKINKLIEFFEKLGLFSDRMNSETVRAVIQSLYRNVELFSGIEMGVFGNSEYNRAKSLVLNLIDDKVDKSEIRSTVEEVVRNVKELEFAVSFVHSCNREQRSGFHNILENIDFGILKEIVSDRLETHFIKNKKDIFKEYSGKEWERILSRWGTNWMSFDGKNKKEVNDYVFELIDKHPDYIGKIVNRFITQQPPHGEKQIDYDALGKLYDLDRLYGRINERKEECYLNSAEQDEINLFIKVYESKKR